VIALLCIIANGEDFEDMKEYGHQNKAFLSAFLSLPHGIPFHDTFRRVFGILDTKDVLSLLTEHSASLLSCLQEKQVCIDDKKLRGATPKASPESGVGGRKWFVCSTRACGGNYRHIRKITTF
jgi:hypothetical protein